MIEKNEFTLNNFVKDDIIDLVLDFLDDYRNKPDPMIKFTHVIFYLKNIEKAIDFYKKPSILKFDFFMKVELT